MNLMRLRPWKRHSLVLAVLGTVYILIGWTLIIPAQSPARESALRLALNLMPLPAWGAVWIVVGCLGIISSRWPPTSETWGYAAMSGLAALWGCFYAGGITLGAPMSMLTGALGWWVIAFLWWSIAGLKNPEGR